MIRLRLPPRRCHDEFLPHCERYDSSGAVDRLAADLESSGRATSPNDPAERAKVIAQIFQVNARNSRCSIARKEVGLIGQRTCTTSPFSS